MITKYISQPWFDAILSQTKQYEGRVCKNFWKDLTVGLCFLISDGNKLAKVQVEELKYFKDFGEAWFVLGEKLIPSYIENVTSMPEANKIYRKFYDSKEVQENGVVAVKLNVTSLYT